MDAQRLKVRERNITARERALDAREASLREDKKVHERASAVHREGIASKEEELVRRGAEVDTKRALAAKRMERADSILQSAKARRSGRRVALAEAAWLYRADDGEVHGPFLSKKVRDFSVLDARCAFEAAAAVHDATRFFFSGSCSITHSNTCPSPPLPSLPTHKHTRVPIALRATGRAQMLQWWCRGYFRNEIKISRTDEPGACTRRTS